LPCEPAGSTEETRHTTPVRPEGTRTSSSRDRLGSSPRGSPDPPTSQTGRPGVGAAGPGPTRRPAPRACRARGRSPCGPRLWSRGGPCGGIAHIARFGRPPRAQAEQHTVDGSLTRSSKQEMTPGGNKAFQSHDAEPQDVVQSTSEPLGTTVAIRKHTLFKVRLLGTQIFV